MTGLTAAPARDTPFEGVSADEMRRAADSRSLLHGRLSRAHSDFWRDQLPVLERLADSYGGATFELGAHRGGRHAETPVDAARASEALSAGGTIRYVAVQEWIAAIGDWLGSVARLLRADAAAVGANLYRSEAEGGLPPHYDGHDILVIQLRGAKSWRAAANARTVVPGRNRLGDADIATGILAGRPPPAASPLWRDIELNEGEGLFLAAGTWHATRALRSSLSITCGFRGRG